MNNTTKHRIQLLTTFAKRRRQELNMFARVRLNKRFNKSKRRIIRDTEVNNGRHRRVSTFFGADLRIACIAVPKLTISKLCAGNEKALTNGGG